ncbi:MAG TPA: hypothetical protein VEA99_16080 [Gemmatimonadaceae bacterium]|nr:hypothetical protein [Gemmatimonadaceae bacterium]
MADRELSPVVATEGTTRTEVRAPDRETETIAERGAADRKAQRGDNGRGELEKVIPDVRASDIEPYTGLRYLSRLFKLMGVILVLLLVAEVVTGLSTQGSAAIPTLLGEASRLLVFAGLLWGSGDLAHLLIDMGHDIRASRILMTRQVHHLVGPKVAKAVTNAIATADQGDTAHVNPLPPDGTR